MTIKFLAAAFIAGFMIIAPAQASLYNFTQTGYEEGASISGSFSASDVNSDGWISGASWSNFTEISDYTVSWSGNSLVSAFTHIFADLTALNYQPSRTELGDVDPEIIASNWFTTTGFIYVSGVGAGSQGGSVLNMALGTESLTTNLIQVTPAAVPVPAAIWLFGSAMAGFIGLRHRNKSAA
ncbi:VPLPA-CTERM sorting domain-containing protein [Methylobacter psychrophilus]|uniref:VPLPA-CTERM sorting domain-containing protein n=1 Tax=Methylobacter psychrophilus TaxID=96941 RepID=UPI0021D49E42|nr:VPLPA-CTERM sorting domain-containing protein [Methylobacter psychrophilus]